MEFRLGSGNTAGGRSKAGAAARRVIQLLCELVNEGGHRERMRFTAALANGRDLFAFRFAANDKANTLYFREDGERLIVVSEPFDKDPNWIEVPPNHVLIALASQSAEVVPFLPAYATENAEEPLQMQRVVARA